MNAVTFGDAPKGAYNLGPAQSTGRLGTRGDCEGLGEGRSKGDTQMWNDLALTTLLIF